MKPTIWCTSVYVKGGEIPSGANYYETVLGRGRFDGTALQDIEDVFVADAWSTAPGGHGARILFAPDGTIFMTQPHRRQAAHRGRGGPVRGVRESPTRVKAVPRGGRPRLVRVAERTLAGPRQEVRYAHARDVAARHRPRGRQANRATLCPARPAPVVETALEESEMGPARTRRYGPTVSPFQFSGKG